MTITGNNKLDMSDPTNITVTVEKQVGSLKTVLRLAGTNLDATKTEVHAIGIDGVNKNGVI